MEVWRKGQRPCLHERPGAARFEGADSRKRKSPGIAALGEIHVR
jgi:hypothetical protein